MTELTDSAVVKTSFLFWKYSIQAPSGDVYAKPFKNTPAQDTEDEHGLQNHNYSNMQGWN